MPGFGSSSSSDTTSPSQSLKKRKRDPLDGEIVNLPHPNAFVSSFHPLDSSLHHSFADLAGGYTSMKTRTHHSADDHNRFRPRCLPRKRRLIHPQQLQPQSQHLHPSSSWTISSPAYPASTITHSYSPPVSPKTLIPLAYPTHPYPGLISSHPQSLAASLRPCHICHRRPTTREVLDAYADCDLCGERACYICLRQCDSVDCCRYEEENLVPLDGSSAHAHNLSHGLEKVQNSSEAERRPRKVCSCCAVEGITDLGLEVVRCLTCVRGRLPPHHDQIVGEGLCKY